MSKHPDFSEIDTKILSEARKSKQCQLKKDADYFEDMQKVMIEPNVRIDYPTLNLLGIRKLWV